MFFFQKLKSLHIKVLRLKIKTRVHLLYEYYRNSRDTYNYGSKSKTLLNSNFIKTLYGSFCVTSQRTSHLETCAVT